jgi:HEAT repeat protein
MLDSNDKQDISAATRRIWTDWPHYSEDDKEIISLHGEKILGLLKSDKSGRNSWHYILSLGTIDYSQSKDLIFDLLLNSKNENIRGFAADALGRFTSLDSKMVDKLWCLSKEDDSLVVRINTLRAITSRFKGSKNAEIAKKTLNLLDKGMHSAIRTNILQILGDIGSTSVVPDLTHIMIARRTKMDKKGAGLALDQIAKENGYHDRMDLVKKITGQNIH